MQKLKWLFPIATALMLSSGCQEIKDPEFRTIENFKVKNLSFQDTEIGFSITYFNPNNFGVAVKEADTELFIDSIPVGTFVQDAQIQVQKNAEFSIPLSGKISFETAKKLNLQTLALREVFVQAIGKVKVGKGGIFVTRDVKYEGKHRLSIKL